MKIKVIGSGSSGNCYRIDDGKTALLIECGLPIKKIKAGCDFDMASISGCLITHEHGDHARAVSDVMAAGVDVYTTSGTACALGITSAYRLSYVSPMVSFNTGSFRVVPFEIHHDAAAPVGYFIESQHTKERLLFMTDSYYTEYKFPGLTHIMIEANYSEEALASAENDMRRSRLKRSHMSIENCIEMLKANDLSQVKEIWLIHLSESNGSTKEFKRRVQEATGCEVYVA